MRISSRKRRELRNLRKARLAKTYNVSQENSNYSKSEELEKIIKEAWVDLSNNKIINDEEIIDNENITVHSKHSSICCRLLKRLNIFYMLKRPFKNRSQRIYPH